MVSLAHHARRLWRAIGSARYKARHRFWDFRRNLVRRLTNPALARRLSRYKEDVARRDWLAALEVTREIATLAEAQRDAKLMEEMGKSLWLLGKYQRAALLRLESRRLRGISPPNEWTGENLSGKTLLVDLMETTKQGLSHAFLQASLVAQVVTRAKHCMVIVEPRIVPLFRRSFPDVEVIAAGAGREAAYAKADFVASSLHLAAIFSTDAGTIEKNFKAIVAEPALVGEFRVKYRRQSRPVVGISWASAAFGKDVPRLEDWARLLEATDATFVSLQYGDIQADLETLRGGDSNRLVHDETVDQMIDMDRFAAQVASLDAVVSISNTAAHLAGALGVPTLVLPDDRLRLWPAFGERVPWYPNTIVVRKDWRAWERVLLEAQTRLEAMLADPSRGIAGALRATEGARLHNK